MCYMGLHFSHTFPWVLQHFECERECERKCEKSVSRSVSGVWGRGEGGVTLNSRVQVNSRLEPVHHSKPKSSKLFFSLRGTLRGHLMP